MVAYMVTVQKFDPASDEDPKFVGYTLEYEEPPTILSALRDIRLRFDSELAFRESCGFGKCGSCALMQNGKAVLACRTLLEKEARLEPLSQYPVVRDLVVDREGWERRLEHMNIHMERPTYLRKMEEPFQWSDAFMNNAACISCLVCQSECPAYAQTPSAFPGPAALMQLGKMLHSTLDAGDRGRFAWSAGVHNCTACMRCEHVCPKGLSPFREGVAALRGALRDEHLEMPTMQAALSQRYESSGSIVGGSLAVPNRRNVQKNSENLLYLGCMYADRYPKMGEKALELLERMGIEVCIPEGLVCCGGPLRWVGDKKAAEDAFARNIDVFLKSGAKRIIVPCPGCCLTIKEDYTAYYKGVSGEDFPLEVVDLTSLLSAGLNAQTEEEKVVAAVYHAPCHHGRGLGRTNEALSLLKQRKDIRLLDFASMDRCCGGMVSTSNPASALAHSEAIVKDAMAVGAQLLITNCVFCRDNLSRAARRHGGKLRVVCLMELI